MLRYLLRRLLYFIPTLFAVSLVSFFLSSLVPGDPVRMSFEGKELDGALTPGDRPGRQAYLEQRHRMGLDRPPFYFSISDATVPDTLHRIPDPQRREEIRRLAWEYGDWELVARFLEKQNAFQRSMASLLQKKRSDPLIEAKGTLGRLIRDPGTNSVERRLFKIERKLERAGRSGECEEEFKELAMAFNRMSRNRTRIPRYIPQVHWHGSKNRYHLWLFGDRPWFSKPDPEKAYRSAGFLRGDLGQSYSNGRPVSSMIGEALQWTLLFSGLSVLLVYGLSIPIGVFMSMYQGRFQQKGSQGLLLFLYSLPEFWVGTILIALFANPDVLKLFPAAFSLMEFPEEASLWERGIIFIKHLTLPLFCYTYGSLAYVSRQMEGGMIQAFGEDFMRAVQAKGVPRQGRVWKHAFRNALLPIITLFGTVLPFLISGSVIIESIFSIPGMGKLAYDALLTRDHPTVFSLVMISAILTMLGTLLSDLLYAWADPRIRYEKRNSSL